MSLLRRAAEQRVVAQFGDSSIPTNGSLATLSHAGVAVNDTAALKVGAFMACVRLLSSAIAGRPLQSMSNRDGILVPVTPTPTIVADPFGGANNVRFPSRRAGLKMLAISLLLRGNGYAMVTARDWLYRPSRLMVLHPDVVKVNANDDGGRDYTVNRIPVDDPNDMVHLTGMCLPGTNVGISPISYARQSIGLALAAEQFGAMFFGKGAHMTGVITTDADLDRNKARVLKENFEGGHSGLSNSHAVGVLTGGAKWTSISISPEDAQFLGTRAAQNLDIAMLMGVPPHMLGQVDRTTSWGTGIEQQNLGFMTWTLDDWLGTFEDAWTPLLPRGQSGKFDTTSLQRTDTNGRYSGYVLARTAGLLSQNEIRAKENEPPVPGGDDINAPLNSAHTDAPEPDSGPGPAPTEGE